MRTLYQLRKEVSKKYRNDLILTLLIGAFILSATAIIMWGMRLCF